MKKPNILYIMCDQFRFDCINALGNTIIQTPNLDRLVKRGRSYVNAYSPCPVCVPARYVVRTGKEPYNLGCYCNESPDPVYTDAANGVESYCGEYLARRMKKSGYYTFGIGKFHTSPDPYEELGYDVQIHTEELYDTPEIREKDGFASYIQNEHPEYAHLEQLHGERTNMYFVPQMSGMPAEHTVEAFTAKKAVEQLAREDDKPFFGFVSFVGPHPPCAPPIPYNRMYDPDGMPNPVRGNAYTDSMDEQIAWMNYLIYADDINDAWARNWKTRYYGEISYIDDCIGKILDKVEERPDAEDTMICFFSDHGEMAGDHGGWQKESFFEESVKIPFLLSCPAKWEGGQTVDDLISLTDLYGIAAAAAGDADLRDGINVLEGEKREVFFGTYGRPGTNQFKMMVRKGQWKYIYMANGGRKQLFHLGNDPHELTNLVSREKEVSAELHAILTEKCKSEPGLKPAVCNGEIYKVPYTPRKLERLHQFDFSRNITDYIVPSGCEYMSAALQLEEKTKEKVL